MLYEIRRYFLLKHPDSHKLEQYWMLRKKNKSHNELSYQYEAACQTYNQNANVNTLNMFATAQQKREAAQ